MKTTKSKIEKVIRWKANGRLFVTYDAALSYVDKPESTLEENSVVEVFGEAKALKEWAEDPRCQVNLDLLIRRLRKGITGTDLVRRRTTQIVEIFGERKTIKEWTRDPRCEVLQKSIRDRLREGVEGEALLKRVPRRKSPLYEIFGEQKTAEEWAGDPRCEVSQRTVRNRLKEGLKGEALLKKRSFEPNVQKRTAPLYEAFGESKTALDWARDPRAHVSHTTIQNRFRKGLRGEALLAPPQKGRTPRKWKAFGEERTLREWVEDPRCEITENTLRRKLKAGEPLEQAMKAQPRGRRPGSSASKRPRIYRRRTSEIEAWGETKAFHEWLEDPRVIVSETALAERLCRNWPFEKAATTPSNIGHPLVAFGEIKSITEWARDDRCPFFVPYQILHCAKRGWSVEEIMTSTPCPECSSHRRGSVCPWCSVKTTLNSPPK